MNKQKASFEFDLALQWCQLNFPKRKYPRAPKKARLLKYISFKTNIVQRTYKSRCLPTIIIYHRSLSFTWTLTLTYRLALTLELLPAPWNTSFFCALVHVQLASSFQLELTRKTISIKVGKHLLT